MEKKYEEELAKQISESNKRENILNADLSRKDDEINNLRVSIKAITTSRDQIRVAHKALINETNGIISEREKVIEELNHRLSGVNKSRTCSGLKRVKSDKEMIRLKPKRTTKTIKAPTLNCKFEHCKEKYVDLAKCNVCYKWVCETCHDVPVTKLKQVMNKCKSVYFICKECDENVGNVMLTVENETVPSNVGNTELLSSLQKMFDKKI